MRGVVGVASLAVTLTVVGCSTTSAPTATGSPPTTPLPSGGTSPTPSLSPVPVSGRAAPIDPEASPAVEASLNEAASRLGVERSALRVESVEDREWTDRSLGCPREGVLYAQVITPGYLVILESLESNGRRLEYHADNRGTTVFCREL